MEVKYNGYVLIGAASASQLQKNIDNYDYTKLGSKSVWEKLWGTPVTEDELKSRARDKFARQQERKLEKSFESVKRDKDKAIAKIKSLDQEKKDLGAYQKRLKRFENNNTSNIPSNTAGTGQTKSLYQLVPATQAQKDTVSRMFGEATGVGDGGSDQRLSGRYKKLQVLGVWRVENPIVRNMYNLHKEMVNAKGCGNNEKRLFHVTGEAALDSILRKGFTDAYSGTSSGSAFGDGVYFADDMGKSDQYSTLFQDGMFKGKHVALVCKVNLGCSLSWKNDCAPKSSNCFFVTKRALKNLPTSKSDTYDSIIVEKRPITAFRFREYVLFNEAAKNGAFPEYVVTYKRV